MRLRIFPSPFALRFATFGTLDEAEAEELERSYTEITDRYLPAMPRAAVNGVDYTANVIDQPERFHILEGRTCIAENEIVMTKFIAVNFGLGVGDTVTVSAGLDSGEYTITGVYSCVNNMGELNGNEKYYYRPKSLPTNSKRPGNIHAGGTVRIVWCCSTRASPAGTATPGWAAWMIPVVLPPLWGVEAWRCPSKPRSCTLMT